MKISSSLLVFLGASLASGAALADRTAGQAKAKEVCAACHGESGEKGLLPDYPILAGQHRDYLVKALSDYKSGARKNAIMSAQVEKLSVKDIQNLADWYSSRRGPLAIKH